MAGEPICVCRAPVATFPCSHRPRLHAICASSAAVRHARALLMHTSVSVPCRWAVRVDLADSLLAVAAERMLL